MTFSGEVKLHDRRDDYHFQNTDMLPQFVPVETELFPES